MRASLHHLLAIVFLERKVSPLCRSVSSHEHSELPALHQESVLPTSHMSFFVPLPTFHSAATLPSRSPLSHPPTVYSAAKICRSHPLLSPKISLPALTLFSQTHSLSKLLSLSRSAHPSSIEQKCASDVRSSELCCK